MQQMLHPSRVLDELLRQDDQPAYEERELKSTTRSRVWKDFERTVIERMLINRVALESGRLSDDLREMIEKNGWTPREADCFLRGAMLEQRYMLEWPEETLKTMQQTETANE